MVSNKHLQAGEIGKPLKVWKDDTSKVISMQIPVYNLSQEDWSDMKILGLKVFTGMLKPLACSWQYFAIQSM